MSFMQYRFHNCIIRLVSTLGNQYQNLDLMWIDAVTSAILIALPFFKAFFYPYPEKVASMASSAMSVATEDWKQLAEASEEEQQSIPLHIKRIENWRSCKRKSLMLLLSLKKYNAVLAIPLVLMLICLTEGIAFSKDESSANFHKAFSNLIDSASKENKHLLDGWNDYIIKVMGYSNAEHLKVIEELTMDYAKSYKAFDEKYGKGLDQDKIKYTPQWLDELVAKFGQDFVCNNERAVMLNLMMVFDRGDAKKYDPDAKEIISKELILYLAYERYLGVFINYYNQLSEKDRKKMKAWKEVAEKYLSITKTSHFAFTYYSRHMENKVRNNALLKENKELYMYFKNADLPFGGGALSQAMEDMDRFIEMCKMQSKITRE